MEHVAAGGGQVRQQHVDVEWAVAAQRLGDAPAHGAAGVGQSHGHSPVDVADLDKALNRLCTYPPAPETFTRRCLPKTRS